VAILDTGVIPYHPDLGGRGPQEPGHFWINIPERDGVAGVDDDGNGFIDDTQGWDFVALPTHEGEAPGEDVGIEDNDPNDFVGHGTSVAGLVGGLTNNQIGIAAVTWKVRLMPLRVGWAYGDRLSGVIDVSYLARAIRYATRMGAQIINLSVSTTPLPDLESAVMDAVAAGVVVVAAAGNNGSPDFVGGIPGVITVTATDLNDVVPVWANRGPKVDLAAPGAAIATTNLTRVGTDSLGLRQGGYVLDANGTSFATPLVSGAAALVQSVRREMREPLFNSEQMRWVLMRSADDIHAQNPGVSGYGAGRLNLARALERSERVHFTRSASSDTFSAAVLPSGTGAPWLATTTREGKLVFSRTPDLDSLDAVALGSIPVGSIAAADLGGGRGLGLFVALQDGKVAGFTGSGRSLPGWPVSTAGRLIGPLIGDLDADGEMEIVCADAGGQVWAWEADGSRRTGFPKTVVWPTTSAIGILPVLANLDGARGAEIVVAQEDGTLWAIDGHGNVLSGWPSPTGLEPIHALLAARDALGTLILAVSPFNVRGFRASGALAFKTSISTDFPFRAYPPMDLALADLNGDSQDDLIVRSALSIDAFTLAGARLSGAWPRAVDTTFSAVTLVGGEGASRTILSGSRIGSVAFGPDGLPSTLFIPIPMGSSPTWATIAGHSRLFGGGASDGYSYTLDVGSSTSLPWPTYRGSFARTGSRADTPPMAEIAPDPVSGLLVKRTWESGAEITWRASGDDGLIGSAARYLVVAEALDAPGPVEQWDVPGGIPAGGAMAAEIQTRTGGLYRITVTAIDLAGQSSLATSLEATIEGGPSPQPPQPPERTELLIRNNPGVPPVRFQWGFAGGVPPVAPRLRVYDATGRRRFDLTLPRLAAGTYSWDGRDAKGQNLPAGLYFAELSTTRPEARVKIVLLAPR